MLSFEWNFLGLSSETKPVSGEKVIDGSTYYECDTSNFYIYYQGNWYKQTFITEDGINVYVYKFLMRKMFKRSFDTNISKLHIYHPDIDSNISFTSNYISNITDMNLLGNSEQQTYTGKNLWNPTPYSNNRVIAANGNIVNVEGGAIWEYASVSASTQYTISFTATTGGTLRVHSYDSGGNWIEQIAYKTISDNETASLSFTTPSTIGILRWSFYNDLTTPQLEVGSGPTTYEPYVGGVPAPNPSYPQDVKVVTGEQTVTISNGDVQNVYTVDLGTIELAKVGDYQDYIYKSGDDWYVHKETKKVIFDGSADEDWTTATSSGVRFFRIDTSDGAENSEQLVKIISDRFIGRFESVSNAIVISGSIAGRILIFINDIAQNVTQWKAWLADNNVTCYYAIETPTDTKITDSTLTQQLNNILDYTFPAGVNNVVVIATDLPALLQLTITERE
jgi:hypothetical protein